MLVDELYSMSPSNIPTNMIPQSAPDYVKRGVVNVNVSHWGLSHQPFKVLKWKWGFYVNKSWELGKHIKKHTQVMVVWTLFDYYYSYIIWILERKYTSELLKFYQISFSLNALWKCNKFSFKVKYSSKVWKCKT